MVLRIFICPLVQHQIRCFSSASFSKCNRYKLLDVSDRDAIRSVRLNSPKTRNALSLNMLEELSLAFEEANQAPDVRCVLLSAVGHVFSAGHNLKELTKEQGGEHHELVFGTCTRLMELLVTCPVPIVAKVDGVAAAAGCQMVAMCDVVVASDRSTFSTPGVNLGFFCSTPGVAVARAVPAKTAAYMLYTGLPLTADEALAAGLVSRVVPVDRLDEETDCVVESIRRKSRPVIRLGKKFLKHQVKLDVLDAYREGEKIMVGNLQLADAQEGIASFIEKRHPNFRDE